MCGLLVKALWPFGPTRNLIEYPWPIKSYFTGRQSLNFGGDEERERGSCVTKYNCQIKKFNLSFKPGKRRKRWVGEWVGGQGDSSSGRYCCTVITVSDAFHSFLLSLHFLPFDFCSPYHLYNSDLLCFALTRRIRLTTKTERQKNIASYEQGTEKSSQSIWETARWRSGVSFLVYLSLHINQLRFSKVIPVPCLATSCFVFTVWISVIYNPLNI